MIILAIKGIILLWLLLLPAFFEMPSQQRAAHIFQRGYTPGRYFSRSRRPGSASHAEKRADDRPTKDEMRCASDMIHHDMIHHDMIHDDKRITRSVAGKTIAHKWPCCSPRQVLAPHVNRRGKKKWRGHRHV